MKNSMQGGQHQVSAQQERAHREIESEIGLVREIDDEEEIVL